MASSWILWNEKEYPPSDSLVSITARDHCGISFRGCGPGEKDHRRAYHPDRQQFPPLRHCESVDYIRNRKGDILSLVEKSWGIKDPDVGEGIYQDLVGLYSRTGIASDETMKNVIRLVQEARKSGGSVALSDVADWSFAKKANEDLKKR